MKIVVSATGAGLNAAPSPVFGRAPYLVFVDTDTMAWEALANPAATAGGGAGIQAAQLVVGRGVQAVIATNVGPNAFQVFQAAGVSIRACSSATVEEAVRAFVAGRLPALGAATTGSHTGTAPAAPSPTEDTVADLEARAEALRAELGDLRRRIETMEGAR